MLGEEFRLRHALPFLHFAAIFFKLGAHAACLLLFGLGGAYFEDGALYTGVGGVEYFSCLLLGFAQDGVAFSA